jgi:hypothetical protein
MWWRVEEAPIALRALPQRVGEELVIYTSPNLLGEYPKGVGGLNASSVSPNLLLMHPIHP